MKQPIGKGCISKIQRMEWSRDTKVTSDLTEKKTNQSMKKAVLSIIKRFYCKQNTSNGIFPSY
jgi:hypothetical protein